MATADQYAAWIVANKDKQGTPEFETVASAYKLAKSESVAPKPSREDQIKADQERYSPTAGMSAFEKARAGYGKAVADLGRGVGNLVTDAIPSASKLGFATRANTDETKSLDAALMDTGAGMTGNIVGNIANIAPTMLIPGANTIGGGAAIGAVSGLMQPVGTDGSRTANTAIGGVAGGAVPALLQGGKLAKAALVDPFTNAGQQRIVGRALNTAAGNGAELAANNMRAAAQPFVGPSAGNQAIRQTMGEIVPGSIPTAAQVADNPGIAALQRAASQTDPTVMNEFANIIARQNAARVNSLQNVAGDDGMRAFFAADRDSVANQLYGDAFKNSSGNLTPYMKGQITQLLKRPSIDDASKMAQKLALERGEKPAAQGSLRALHDVKTALDDKIADAVQRNAGGEVKALMGTKEKLLDTMERMSPGYAEARSTYAAMSKPINQMDTAQLIADKSVNALTGNIQPNAFAKALSDGTAAKASGFKGATLENTLDSHSLNSMNAIKDDLASSAFAQNAGRGVGSDTVQKLAYSNIIGQSGLPSLVTSLAPSQMIGRVAGQGANMLYSNANKELSGKLAEALMNPATAAEAMQAAGVPMSEIAKMLMLGSQGGMTALPAIVNGAQQ